MKEIQKKCELECPKCHERWATLKFKYGSCVNAKDVTIIKGAKEPYKNGDNLACSLCAYQYTNWDIMLAIASKGEKAVIKNEISPLGTYLPHKRKS